MEDRGRTSTSYRSMVKAKMPSVHFGIRLRTNL